MDDSLYSLALATLAFVGGHFVLSSAPVRGPLAGLLGERAFLAVYSLLAVATLVWMVRAFNQATPVPLWDPPPFGRQVAVLLMLVSAILFVCGATSRNPTLAGFDLLRKTAEPGRGIYAVTRHPLLWAFALWGIAHLFVRGDVPALFLFGGIVVLAIGGMLHIDARRRARGDEAWQAFEAGTARLPFRAILDGRQRLSFADIGLWRIALGVVLYVLLVVGHGPVIGIPLARS